MKKSFLFTLLAVLALTTSCVSQKNNSGFAVKPNEVRLEIGMDDLTYLGTVNVEIEYKKYGAITKIYTVNGTNYDPRYFTETTIIGKTKGALFAKRKVHEKFKPYSNRSGHQFGVRFYCVDVPFEYVFSSSNAIQTLIEHHLKPS